MSDTPFVNEHLMKAALERAAKQFPGQNPEEVVQAVASQHQEIMKNRPVVQGPMRDHR